MASLDDGKFRDCIETIRARLAQAQQLKASGQQVATAAISVQVYIFFKNTLLNFIMTYMRTIYLTPCYQISQAEEIQKRLKDVVARLENEVKGELYKIVMAQTQCAHVCAYRQPSLNLLSYSRSYHFGHICTREEKKKKGGGGEGEEGGNCYLKNQSNS